jgi:hypothetical protein
VQHLPAEKYKRHHKFGKKIRKTPKPKSVKRQWDRTAVQGAGGGGGRKRIKEIKRLHAVGHFIDPCAAVHSQGDVSF